MRWIEDLIIEKPQPVCKKGDFVFAAIGLEHGHINNMCKGLIKAGAVLKWVYDEDDKKIAAFQKMFPGVRSASSKQIILEDSGVHLIATAAIPSERYRLGIDTMEHGKDFFTAKTPFTRLEQLEEVKLKIAETNQKYAVFYSERLGVESAIFAGRLIEEGAIGRVVQVMGMGPHRLRFKTRPDWFFKKEQYGGILCDIGSHQIEQFLFYSGAKDAKVTGSKIGNYQLKDYPEFEDFGDATLVGDNGATNYFRVDWLTPDGLGAWGDGRVFILGTEGYIELRKNIDVARDATGDQLYIVNGEKEAHLNLRGKVGTPFFGELVLDCLNRTENAMSQVHALKAAELCLIAQMEAIKVES
jgi:predicted dehydrogenase